MSNTFTGNTGNPVQDGVTRAGWTAAVQGLIAFSIVRWDWLTVEELAILEIPILFGAVAAWGMWDWIRQKL
jgi:hypothetical protein